MQKKFRLEKEAWRTQSICAHDNDDDDDDDDGDDDDDDDDDELSRKRKPYGLRSKLSSENLVTYGNDH